MKWRCALIQPRLPDYPDGDLSPFWKRQVASHLAVCPECRRELEEITEVVSLYQAQPLPDPGPAFWQDFNRELHLRLAQVNQAPVPTAKRLRLPHYLLGATAATVAMLALAVYLGPWAVSKLPSAQPGQEAKAPVRTLPPETPRVKLATTPAPASPSTKAGLLPAQSKTLPVQAASPATPPVGKPQYSLAAGKLDADQRAAQEVEKLLSEDDVLDWDVDSVVADLSREQQQHLKSKLETRR